MVPKMFEPFMKIIMEPAINELTQELICKSAYNHIGQVYGDKLKHLGCGIYLNRATDEQSIMVTFSIQYLRDDYANALFERYKLEMNRLGFKVTR